MTVATATPTIKYNGNTSKETELEALRKFAAQFGPNTYVASFLSDAAIEWLARQMRGDMDTDLHAYVASAERRQNEAERKQQDLERKLAESNEALRAAADMLSRDVLDRDARIERLNHEMSELRQQYGQSYSEARDLERKLEAAENEIIRLKAKLYDLLCK